MLGDKGTAQLVENRLFSEDYMHKFLDVGWPRINVISEVNVLWKVGRVGSTQSFSAVFSLFGSGDAAA